jgi:hypothetical protein
MGLLDSNSGMTTELTPMANPNIKFRHSSNMGCPEYSKRLSAVYFQLMK